VAVAYLRQRSDGRVEVRESTSTPAGPRARTLAIFRGPLTRDVLERAAVRARRPFRPELLRRRADALGIGSSERRGDAAARSLLADLRAGVSIDPLIASLLKSALQRCAAAELPDPLAEVAEWVGVGTGRRGRALRGLLRASDRLVRTRPRRRQRARARFPRFRSLPEAPERADRDAR
jgi:hypothetical protein